LFRFRHRFEEIWRDRRRMSLRNSMLEHDMRRSGEGKATPEGFRVESKDGSFIAPVETLTSNSLWTSAVSE